jgi:hypothetical protein
MGNNRVGGLGRSGDYMSEMVTTGLLMNMEGCCKLCMGERAAMDGHRMSRSGNTWVGWRGLATWGALFAVALVVLWIVEATG